LLFYLSLTSLTFPSNIFFLTADLLHPSSRLMKQHILHVTNFQHFLEQSLSSPL
jgi:hypothetical protein